MMKSITVLLFILCVSVFLFVVVGTQPIWGQDKRETVVTEIDYAKGKAVFETTCIRCHGKDGRGVIPGIPNFTGRKSPLYKADDELMKNVWNGYKSPGAFLSMPPKGGNPDLTEVELQNVIQYIRKTFSKKK